MKYDDLCIDKHNMKQVFAILSDIVSAEGKPMRLSIRRWIKKRSLDQNALMWVWYAEIARQIKLKTGESYTAEDLHEHFKKLYCPVKEIEVMGTKTRIRSTTKLDKGEMHFYLQQVEFDVARLGIILDAPDNSEYMNLKQEQLQ